MFIWDCKTEQSKEIKISAKTDLAHLPEKLKWRRHSYFNELKSILKIRPKFITDVEISNENIQQCLWISSHAGILEMKLPSPDKVTSEGSLKK